MRLIIGSVDVLKRTARGAFYLYFAAADSLRWAHTPHPIMARIADAKLVKGFVPGTQTDTFVLGDVAEARKIAERSLDVVKRFSEAVIKQDIETAYGLCAMSCVAG